MTRDRLVAALKPIALNELSGEEMDQKIAAIVETPRHSAVRTRRAPRKRLLLTAAGVGAAAVATAIIVVSDGGSGGHNGGVVSLNPAKAQAAALSFTQKGGYLTVIVKDPTADPARYKKEFAEHGLNVDLRLTPSSPKKVGSVLFLEDDGGGKVKTVTAKGRCGDDTCQVGIKVPLTYKPFVRVIFGRTARPGEHYQTGPGDTPGEGVGLSDVRGRTVADVLAEARKRHIGHIAYRYQPTSRDEQGAKQPYPMGIPADKVKGDWRVYDAVAGNTGQVLLFVHP
jgi:hypothetical protein